MAKYNVTYWYLATGMENGPDTHDYGIIKANSAEEAKKKIAIKSANNEFYQDQTKEQKDQLIDFTMSCLSAKEVDANIPESYKSYGE